MRGIPPVRRWRVRYWLNDTLLAEIVVETINKEFARWMAGERMRGTHLDRWLATNRVTVSLVRQ